MRKNREWRLIYSGKDSAFFNMALDEALLILCQEKDAPPVLRLYQWNPKAVSFGYSQGIEKTLDLRKCKEMNVDVVRRITGGRAVLHDNDLTYSICASKDHFDLFGESINETYKRISLAFLKSLDLLKIKGEWATKSSQENHPTHFDSSKPCFSSSLRYEIKVDGRKLIGSAQRRYENGFIQHGSIALKNQSPDLLDLLPGMNEQRKQKMKTRFERYSVSIQNLLFANPDINQIQSAVKSGFDSFFSVDLTEVEPSAQERKLTQKLIPKYSSEEWNFLR